MAKKSKGIDVQKFGGTEHLGETKMHGHKHDVETVEAQSKTKIEDDVGYGDAAIIRCFEFGMNPTAFNEHYKTTGQAPDSQTIFNAHYKGIETALWKDGMKVMPEVNPRVAVDQKAMRYKIWVGAKPMKGHTLYERPQTLTEIAYGQ